MRRLRGTAALRRSGRSGNLRDVRASLTQSVVASFAGQALLVVSGVLVARLLGPEDRGRFALVVLVPVIVVQVVPLGIPLAVTYFTATGARLDWILRRLRGPIAIQMAIGCALVAILFAILAGVGSLHAGVAAVAATVALPGMLMIGYGIAGLQGVRNFLVFNVLRQAQAGVYVLAVIGLYVADVASVLAVTIAWSASCVLVGIAALGVASRSKDGTKEPPPRRAMLRFGLRGFIGASSPIETYRLDQVTVGLFLSHVSLGLYVVGLAFTNLPVFVAQSIGMVAYPHIASTTDRAKAWRAVVEYVAATTAICVVVCGTLIVLADDLIVLFFGAAFESATDVTRVLLCGAAIVGVRRLLGDSVRGMGLPGAASIAEVAAWVALLPALAICVPLWDLVGVAIALALSYAVSLALLIAVVVRHRKREFDPSVQQADGTTVVREA